MAGNSTDGRHMVPSRGRGREGLCYHFILSNIAVFITITYMLTLPDNPGVSRIQMESSEDFRSTLGQFRKSSEDFGNLLPFFPL